MEHFLYNAMFSLCVCVIYVGCEYGDKLRGCDPSGCATYTADSLAGCCESCPST